MKRWALAMTVLGGALFGSVPAAVASVANTPPNSKTQYRELEDATAHVQWAEDEARHELVQYRSYYRYRSPYRYGGTRFYGVPRSYYYRGPGYYRPYGAPYYGRGWGYGPGWGYGRGWGYGPGWGGPGFYFGFGL